MDGLRFPMFVSLQNKKVMVFGAGKVAYRRIKTLLLFQADITVVSPDVCEEIARLSQQKEIIWIQDSYPNKNVDKDSFFVLATTDKEEVNEQIYRQCKEQNIWINNAGNQQQCDFFFPAVIKTKDVVVGITGDGTSHKKVSKIAQEIRNNIKEVSDYAQD